MKLIIPSIAVFLSGATTAFVPPVTSGLAPSDRYQTSHCAEPKEEAGELDLNLEEMFDMFDAADKGKDFDKVIGDVKKEKKN